MRTALAATACLGLVGCTTMTDKLDIASCSGTLWAAKEVMEVGGDRQGLARQTGEASRDFIVATTTLARTPEEQQLLQKARDDRMRTWAWEILQLVWPQRDNDAVIAEIMYETKQCLTRRGEIVATVLDQGSGRSLDVAMMLENPAPPRKTRRARKG